MRRHMDAMVGGSFLKKFRAKDTFELLEELAKSEGVKDSSRVRKSTRIHGVDKTTLLEAELEKLRLEMKMLKLDNVKKMLQQGNAIESNINRCEIYEGAHLTAECQASEAVAAH